MIDGLATGDTALLKLLVDSVERCVQSGDKRQYREACKMLGISEKSDSVSMSVSSWLGWRKRASAVLR